MLFYRGMDHLKAARDGDLQRLRVALTADNVNDAGDDGYTALHWAARNMHDKCVKYCIEMGANVNARTNSGNTPLHHASWQGQVDIVRVLLDAGAFVDVTDVKDQRTPLYFVIRDNHVEAAQLLIDRGGRVSNVRLDKYLPSIPDWVTTFIESRSKCRCASITIIGIHRYHRTIMTGNNDINVLRLIAKHIWSARMDDVWVISLKVTPKHGMGMNAVMTDTTLDY
jgi:ankyrin repeat protein